MIGFLQNMMVLLKKNGFNNTITEGFNNYVLSYTAENLVG